MKRLVVLLLALVCLMPSVAMAERIGGSESNFVKMMNDKVKELGLKDTNFKNCHGLDEEGHVTSTYDIALMSRELLCKYPEITKYTTIKFVICFSFLICIHFIKQQK